MMEDSGAAAECAREDGIAMNPIHGPYGHVAQEESRSIDVEEAISRIGYGWYQKRLMFLSAALWMADSMEVSLLSFLYSCVGASLNLTPVRAASIVSIVFAGELVGSAVAGPAADALGRKPASLAAAGVVAVAGIATAAAPSFAVFVVLRGIVGVGVGALAVPFDLAAEFLPNDSRGKNLTLLEFAWAGGAMYATAASWATGRNWRLLVLACALPFVFAFLAATLFLDESPVWLVSRGKTAEAQSVVAKVAKVNGSTTATYAFKQVPTKAAAASWTRLWAKDLRTKTFLVWVVWIGFGLDFYGISLLVTKLFDRQGADCAFRYPFILLVTTSEIAGAAALLFSIDRLGRVKAQAIPYVVAASSLVPILFFLDTTWVVFSCLYLALGAQMMASSAAWVHVPELFPTDVRSTAHSFALAVSRLSAFASSYVVDSTLPLPFVVLVLAAAALASALASLALPETLGAHLA
ncbi:hypothetical protein CTAYLR_009285 [Chrysophaeum taylorii]|uniref:Major facilitator superfamily (MFS) profile domain-containing protein n=1 Tax=Chrysophaeum taylorii TaxID=2483200 RepID=A0AAD7XPV9_9STRA|nr:hypothetical protein CTAYLR_009285 [Chrysophaeum taylorii]